MTTINDIEQSIGLVMAEKNKRGRNNKVARIAQLCRELKSFGITGFKASYIAELAHNEKADKTAISKTIKGLCHYLPSFITPAKLNFIMDSPNSQVLSSGCLNFRL